MSSRKTLLNELKMKKNVVLCVCLCCIVAFFTGCKSSESAYKKAYEKAKAQETIEVEPVEENVVTPLVEPIVSAPTVDNVDNVQVRQENVSMVNGSGLRDYSVVVGSFSVPANAEGLQERLRNAGYDAQIVRNEANGMLRVVATTYDNKADAVTSRTDLRATYPDAWILYRNQ